MIFQNINDEHGHLVGDLVLQGFQEYLPFVQEDTDIVARWGGEKFVLMLSQTNIEHVHLVAEN